MAMTYEEIGMMEFDGIKLGPGDNVKCDDGDVSGEIISIIRVNGECHLLIDDMLADAYSVYEVNGTPVGEPHDQVERSVVIPVVGGTGVEEQ